MKIELKSKINIRGEIIVKTGLMIGDSNSSLQIGGADKQVIRNPINKRPYVPGSSLKGKMRSLLEQMEQTVDDKGNPTQDPTTHAAQLFGHIKSKNVSDKQQASRLIVRDGQFLSVDDFDKREVAYTELKSENTINRITAIANPRSFERVPRSARFKLDMTLNIIEVNDGTNIHKFTEEELLQTIYKCLRLVEDDYLGGGGSRGNGQVKFKIEEMTRRTKGFYEGKDKEEDLTSTIPLDLTKDND